MVKTWRGMAMYGIRSATLVDLDNLVALMKALHGESIFGRFPAKDDKIRALAVSFITEPNNIFILFESAASRIDGFMLGYVRPYMFSNELGAWDLALYVRPERRGSTIAYRLWREFKSRAARLGANMLWLGTSAGIEPSRTRKFYTGLGMTEAGTLYYMRLNQTDA
jgi:GNAT superfamily N-acetyltransferase